MGSRKLPFCTDSERMLGGGGVGGYVSMYTINPTTGALASIGPPISPNGFGVYPGSITVDPSRDFAYVINEGDPWGYEAGANGRVAMYNIEATTGALTSTAMIAGGPAPASVAVDRSGKFAYVTNSGSNDVSMCSIGSAGTLTLIATIGT